MSKVTSDGSHEKHLHKELPAKWRQKTEPPILWEIAVLVYSASQGGRSCAKPRRVFGEKFGENSKYVPDENFVAILAFAEKLPTSAPLAPGHQQIEFILVLRWVKPFFLYTVCSHNSFAACVVKQSMCFFVCVQKLLL